jgi:hypothetical protein
MANQHTNVGRWAATTFLLATVGCAFPHGQYGGDPMCGTFNRPIAPTPPVWGGGDPGHSPAYDAGVHLGIPPDGAPSLGSSSSPTPVSTAMNKEKIFIVPTFSGGIGLFRGGSSGSRGNIGGGGGGGGGGGAGTSSGNAPAVGAEMGSSHDSASTAKVQKTKAVAGGARLPSDSTSADTALVATNDAKTNANSVSFRTNGAMLTSGANIEPYAPKKKPYKPLDLTKDPSSIASVEEGQALLRTCGAKFQRLEQLPTGEWSFLCSMGPDENNRRYEAKNTDQLDAIRAVMFQIQNDK